MHFSCSHTSHMPRPLHPPSFNYSNNIRDEYKLYSSSLCDFLLWFLFHMFKAANLLSYIFFNVKISLLRKRISEFRSPEFGRKTRETNSVPPTPLMYPQSSVSFAISSFRFYESCWRVSTHNYVAFFRETKVH
jgi:hypothetical protein